MSPVLVLSKSLTTFRWKKPVIYSVLMLLILFSFFDTLDLSLLETFYSLCFLGTNFRGPPFISVVTPSLCCTGTGIIGVFLYWNGIGLSLNKVSIQAQLSHVLNFKYYIFADRYCNGYLYS